ncbi:MAG: putative phage tail protein [Clostridium sp.]
MIDIKPYFPNIYEGILETDNLIKAENSLFNELDEELNRLLLNQFINTCDVQTLNLHETMLKIVPDPRESIIFRRQRMLNRLSMNSAFTLKFLKQKLNEIIGENNYEIYIDYGNYIMYVESITLNQEWFSETYITINKIKPANMVFVNKPKIGTSIVVNEEVTYSQREYNYRLGTRWRLGAKPFKSLNPKGGLKMKDGKSVTEDLLDSLREKALSRISSIRINNTLIINTFIIKELQSKNIIIEYAVLKKDVVDNINKIEVIDGNNKVLTTIDVYVPVIEDLEIKHMLKVEEGVITNGV